MTFVNDEENLCESAAAARQLTMGSCGLTTTGGLSCPEITREIRGRSGTVSGDHNPGDLERSCRRF